jgi:peptide/nickel transport system permease protein
VLRYITRRLLASIPVVLIVGIMTFSLVHLAPGDPVAALASETATMEELEEIERSLGLDKPFLIQFGIWVNHLLHGDLGTSVFSKRSVGQLMLPRLQPTIALAILGVIMSVSLGLPLGILAAWCAHSAVDRGVMVFAVLGFSIPAFWLAFNLIWLFAVKLSLFKVLGYVPISHGLGPFLKGLFLPALSLSIVQMALIARMTRASMVEVLNEDYIRTARAKGLKETVVLIRHALRAGSIPIVTVIGLSFAALITGVVVIETVFAIPGLGRLVVDAVLRRDFPVIQGMLMVLSIFYVFVNLVVDITYAYLDPRIRY